MAESNFLSWFLRHQERHVPRVAGMLGPEDFEHRLLRERARSDRTGSHFALVTFNLPSRDEGEHRNDVMDRLARTIASRIRLSDVAGWYGTGDRIGMILPGTTKVGAAHLVQQIESALHAGLAGKARAGGVALALECKVFTYPSASIEPVEAANGHPQRRSVG